MSLKLSHWVLLASVLVAPRMVWADSPVTDSVAHPETALHEHEEKADAKATAEVSQQMKEAKATMDQAHKDYKDSLAKNGAHSDITQAALKRYHEAKKDYQKFAKKTNVDAAELATDKAKVSEDKATQ